MRDEQRELRGRGALNNRPGPSGAHPQTGFGGGGVGVCLGALCHGGELPPRGAIYGQAGQGGRAGGGAPLAGNLGGLL